MKQIHTSFISRENIKDLRKNFDLRLFGTSSNQSNDDRETKDLVIDSIFSSDYVLLEVTEKNLIEVIEHLFAFPYINNIMLYKKVVMVIPQFWLDKKKEYNLFGNKGIKIVSTLDQAMVYMNDREKNVREYRHTPCWSCGSSLIWQSDFDFEDYGYEGEGIVSNLICSNPLCNAEIQQVLPLSEEEDYVKIDNLEELLRQAISERDLILAEELKYYLNKM